MHARPITGRTAFDSRTLKLLKIKKTAIMQTKEIGVHAVIKDNQIIAFFTRDISTNENIIYKVDKASLDEIAQLFNGGDLKI